MLSSPRTEARIREIVAQDGRYSVEAYKFTLDGLGYTQEQFRRQGHQGHIDGGQLLLGMRDYARRIFGYLAKTVFEEWRVHTTADFGEVVFNLIDAELLSKQESDTKADFVEVFDFEEAFEREFLHPSAST